MGVGIIAKDYDGRNCIGDYVYITYLNIFYYWSNSSRDYGNMKGDRIL